MYRKMNGQQATRARRGYVIGGAMEAAEEGLVQAGGGSCGGVALAEGTASAASAASMKECPVCKARCFADMSVCYNCLHSFGSPGQQAASRGDDKAVEDVLGYQGSPDGFATDWREEDDASIGGYDVVLRDEGACIPMQVESSFDGAPLDGAAQLPVDIKVNVPEGLSATCQHSGAKQPRPDQLMELIISIKVAQDARSRRGVLPAE